MVRLDVHFEYHCDRMQPAACAGCSLHHGSVTLSRRVSSQVWGVSRPRGLRFRDVRPAFITSVAPRPARKCNQRTEARKRGPDPPPMPVPAPNPPPRICHFRGRAVGRRLPRHLQASQPCSPTAFSKENSPSSVTQSAGQTSHSPPSQSFHGTHDMRMRRCARCRLAGDWPACLLRARLAFSFLAGRVRRVLWTRAARSGLGCERVSCTPAPSLHFPPVRHDSRGVLAG